MKFITNVTKVGSGKNFDEIVKEFQEKKQVKTASVKVAEQEEADSSKQLDVEPLHQTGESTEMPAAGPSAKKEDCTCVKATKEVAPDKEGKDSEQPKVEAKEENTNEPKKEASSEEVKEEENKEEVKEEKEASSEKRFVKIANLDSKNKEFLRKYWTKLYGADYVNALLEDK